MASWRKFPVLRLTPSWQEIAQPTGYRAANARKWQSATARRRLEFLVEPPLQQADAGGKRGRRDLVGEAVHARGRPNADRRPKHLRGEASDTTQLRRAPAQHHPGWQAAQPGFVELLDRQLEGLLQPRLDDLAHLTSRDGPSITRVERRDVDRAGILEQLRQRVAVPDLDLLGRREGGPEPDSQVVAHLKSADGQDPRVYQRAFDEDADVGGPSANVDQGDADLAFGLGEDRLAGGDRLQHQRINANPGALDAPHQVAHRRHRARNNRRGDLDAMSEHADRIFDPVLAVDHVVPGQHMHDLAVARHVYHPRGLERALNVVG